MIYILYITINLVNQKIYIGVHGQDEPYIFDGYYGSGNWKILRKSQKRLFNKQSLKDAIRQYGIENFERETLFYYWTEKEAYNKEAEIVTKEFIEGDWNYNLTVGGNKPSYAGYKDSDETRLLKSVALLGRKKTAEHCANLSKSQRGKPKFKNRKPKPEGFGEKLSIIFKGKHYCKWITNGVDNQYILENLDVPNGWYRGRTKPHNSLGRFV